MSWTAPADAGALPVATHDVRWFAGDADPADEADRTVQADTRAGTSATTSGLAPDTAYRVQTRARGNGPGPWSASAAGRTNPAPRPPAVRGVAIASRPADGDTYRLGETIRVEANGGAIRSVATEVDADLSHDGLDHDAAHKVDWRPRLSVADARVEEGAGAAVEFVVRLGHAASRAVTVDYATADGTARAGEDYTATTGTLTFSPRESSKTVSVAVLDDAHDEGEETFTLSLSNGSGAWLEDGEATATIENADLMPSPLLAPFGRATAEQVVQHIEERMVAPRQRGFRARFAGRELLPEQRAGLRARLSCRSSRRLMGGVPMQGAAPMAMGMGRRAQATFGAGTAGMGGGTGMGGVAGVSAMGGMTGAMGRRASMRRWAARRRRPATGRRTACTAAVPQLVSDAELLAVHHRGDLRAQLLTREGL